MEISDQQFDQIVSMIAESRVEFRQAISDLQFELRAGIAGIRKNQVVAYETLTAIEGDVHEVQKTIRKHDQALDGLTQLGKTNFEMNESILKAIHGEAGSSTMGHGDADTEESRGAGPQ